MYAALFPSIASLQTIKLAQDLGINVVGYLAWTLFGNFEWPHGFSKEHDFGLIARDPETNEWRDTEGFEVVAAVFENTVPQEESA